MDNVTVMDKLMARDFINVLARLKNPQNFSGSHGIVESGDVVSWKDIRFSAKTAKDKEYAAHALYSIFIRQEYKELGVRGRDVVDFGAFIGDTAVYFSKSGAKRVISMEKEPDSYAIAKDNIVLNDVKNVVLLNETASPERLDAIVEQYGLKGAALKLDVEGAEYDILLKSKDGTLRAFSEIMLEYHDGYLNIKRRLEGLGFRVRKIGKVCCDSVTKKAQGLLYAKAGA